jgi:hypothetical protein
MRSRPLAIGMTLRRVQDIDCASPKAEARRDEAYEAFKAATRRDASKDFRVTTTLPGWRKRFLCVPDPKHRPRCMLRRAYWLASCACCHIPFMRSIDERTTGRRFTILRRVE